MTRPLAFPRPAPIGALIGVVALATAVTVAPSAALAQEETDLYAENAWLIDQIGAEAAWESTKGAGVTVAVVDLGIAEEHPFFEDKDILDGTSVMDDHGSNGRQDTDGHGTGVAAAVLYAAPEATILPVRVNSTSDDIGFSTGATGVDIEGIRWAADNGADVIVIPWGETSQADPDEEFLAAVQYAIDMDAVVIASGGNDPDLERVTNPAAFAGVIAVSGTDKSGDAWPYSTTGPEIVLSGPADTMMFPKPQIRDFGEEELYFEAAGTSATAGVVGGVAALVRASHPDLDASNVIQRLISTANDGGAGRTDTLGFGAVNADQAVHADDVQAVTENPLGYPLGEAGASGANPEDASSEPDPATATSEEAALSGGDEASAESDQSLVAWIVISAAVVLVVAGVAVWLVLRARSRSQVQPWQ
jgi:hypothetical protein